jgi:membrane protease YdiL (CAAX protease family)
VPNDPDRSRGPGLWQAWTAGQLTVFALLLLAAHGFWGAVMYEATGNIFVATLAATILAIVVPCAAAAWWRGETIGRAFQLRPGLLPVAIGAAAGLLSWAPASVLAGLSSRLHPPTPEYLALLEATMPTTAVQTVLAYAAVAVAAPVGEELVFRGLLFRLARRRWGWIAAAVLTSLFFGVSHWQPWNLFGLVALGFVFALLYHDTGSLLAAMTAHAVHNVLSLAALLARDWDDTGVEAPATGASDVLLPIASTALLVALLTWLRRHRRGPEPISPADDSD